MHTPDPKTREVWAHQQHYAQQLRPCRGRGTPGRRMPSRPTARCCRATGACWAPRHGSASRCCPSMATRRTCSASARRLGWWRHGNSTDCGHGSRDSFRTSASASRSFAAAAVGGHRCQRLQGPGVRGLGHTRLCRTARRCGLRPARRLGRSGRPPGFPQLQSAARRAIDFRRQAAHAARR